MGATIKFLFKGLLWIATLLLFVGSIFRIFFVDLAKVGHNSMAPTLFQGDLIAIWRGSDFEMGDVVICRSPANAADYVVGRVVGKPGMTLQTVRDQLQVAGTIPERDLQGTTRFFDPTLNRTDDMVYGSEKFGQADHLFFERSGTKLTIRTTKIKVGLFLLGDNRTYPGQDSRAFGEVLPTDCIGKVFMRVIASKDVTTDLPHKHLDIIH